MNTFSDELIAINEKLEDYFRCIPSLKNLWSLNPKKSTYRLNEFLPFGGRVGWSMEIPFLLHYLSKNIIGGVEGHRDDGGDPSVAIGVIGGVN